MLTYQQFRQLVRRMRLTQSVNATPQERADRPHLEAEVDRDLADTSPITGRWPYVIPLGWRRHDEEGV